MAVFEGRWKDPASAVTILDTHLNAVAANTGNSTAGSTITASRNRYANFELTVDFVSAPTAGGYAALYALETVDGTNFPDGSNTVDPSPTLIIAIFPILASTAAQRITFPRAILPANDWKPLLKNFSSQAFPATGSVVKMSEFTDTSEE